MAQIHSKLMPRIRNKNVYISFTKRTGFGVFAKKNIAPLGRIFICKGELATYTSKPTEKKLRETENWMGIGDKLWINPNNDNALRYLNHSCNPNASLTGIKTVIALKPINKDEQITIDYSLTEEDQSWNMKCNCGSNNCRKKIRSIQFLPDKTFKKYYPYLPRYYKEKYSALKHAK